MSRESGTRTVCCVCDEPIEGDGTLVSQGEAHEECASIEDDLDSGVDILPDGGTDMSGDSKFESRMDQPMWEIERVYTHRSEDRTKHHVRADDEREAESILEYLERQGKTDDRGNEIESLAGNPIHVHVYRAPSGGNDG